MFRQTGRGNIGSPIGGKFTRFFGVMASPLLLFSGPKISRQEMEEDFNETQRILKDSEKINETAREGFKKSQVVMEKMEETLHSSRYQ